MLPNQTQEQSSPEVSTVERILQASHGLFYSQGLRAVSLDQVAAAAGLTKRTLYYHFKSKDALVVAWLARRANLARDETLTIKGTALERLRQAFAVLEPQLSHPGFRGCPFVNAVAELADPAHPAVAIAQLYKADRLAWFAGISRELGKPDTYAAILMTLWEGAIARAVINRGVTSVREACAAAEMLLQK
jgi:AcrR family transcriptional regulator